mgnify:CR=1 FL=1
MVIEKIVAAQAHHKKIDGHAPGLAGNDLNAYIQVDVGVDKAGKDQPAGHIVLRLPAVLTPASDPKLPAFCDMIFAYFHNAAGRSEQKQVDKACRVWYNGPKAAGITCSLF